MSRHTRIMSCGKATRHGFTLVEIMIVVAIIALLAAIAIPNVLRGRATANETAAIGNVRALISSLEMYRSVYQAYPETAAQFSPRIYTPNPAFGPPSFNGNPMNGTGSQQGFLYLYSEVPAGAAVVQQYVIKASPQTTGAGTRVIFGSDSGQVFHCSGATSPLTVTTPAQSIDQIPQNC